MRRKNEQKEADDKVTLLVEGVTKRFGGVTALSNVSLRIEKGEVVGLIGPNGAGKTTLFSVISGFERPDTGRVLYKGKDITRWPPYKIAKMGIGRTFQVVKPLQGLTLRENILIAAFATCVDRQQALEKAYGALEFVGLADKCDILAGSLNTAEKKKLELAKTIALDSDLMLLDEVAAGLNPTEVSEMVKIINTLNRNGHTIVAVEHVMCFTMRLVDRLVVLHYGQKIADGPKGVVSEDPKVIEAYLGTKE